MHRIDLESIGWVAAHFGLNLQLAFDNWLEKNWYRTRLKRFDSHALRKLDVHAVSRQANYPLTLTLIADVNCADQIGCAYFVEIAAATGQEHINGSGWIIADLEFVRRDDV
jgi:hypothetical protein